MAKGTLIAAMRIARVAEDEFHDWYDTEHLPERQRVTGFLVCERWLGAEETQTLPDCNVPLQQLGADLIDDAGTLADQRSRTRCRACRSSWSAVLVATNFMVGRCTASAIASASRKSFFCPLLYGRTYLAGINRALWPSSCSLRLR